MGASQSLRKHPIVFEYPQFVCLETGEYHLVFVMTQVAVLPSSFWMVKR